MRLTNAPGPEDHASFSPDGKVVAFVRGNNLFVSDLATGRETALTGDGAAKILNGRLDWVYEEEIYGRGNSRAYWWSPDSSALAFLRIDDTPVPSYPVVDHIPYEQNVEQWDYPKAGDPNPIVRLGVARVTGGSPAWVDTSKYPGRRPPDRARRLVARQPPGRLRRPESHADLARIECRRCGSGAPRTILRETQQVLDQRRRCRAADVAERRLVSLGQRSVRMAAPLSLRRGRHAHQAGDEREMGDAHAPRRR